MMSKIIIDNQSSMDDLQAIDAVVHVIEQGRISNNGKQYCYATTFANRKYAVYTRLNKKSDGFVVVDGK